MSDILGRVSDSPVHRHDPRDPEAEPCCPECCDCTYEIYEFAPEEPALRHNLFPPFARAGRSRSRGKRNRRD